MKILRGIHAWKDPVPYPVVAIGNFDGVHRGHQKIIQIAQEKARAHAGTAIVYTFRPHPQIALRADAHVSLLSTYDEKLEIFKSIGTDIVVEEPFSREFSTTEPEKFFQDVLVHQIQAKEVVVGYDFAFGRERQGHLGVLESFCKKAGVQLTIVQPQKAGEETVSSTRIRQLLHSANLPAANQLLGRNFFYRGVVVKGEGRGRKLGFPTANLKLENKLTLPYGVYATLAVYEGKQYLSVTNLGVRPTFYADQLELPALVETHLLDATIDLYGSTLEVQFLNYLRTEKRFQNIEELKSQIKLDIENARKNLQQA